MGRCAFVLAIFFSISEAFAATDNWHITKSNHFVVYYKDASEDFITKLIDKSEGLYDKIADNLGFRRFNFWLWENRAKIYIYDNSTDYQSATGQPGWSSGCVATRDKIIQTFPDARGFFETILPHEMGHIIFREFVGFDNNAIPLWLDEGVACYQEKSRYAMADGIIKEAISKDRFINLQELTKLNPHLIQDTGLVNLFYAQALSLVDYLIKEFGKDNFVLFCQALRDKKNLEKAIAASYPFNNIQELNQSWLKYLKNN